MVFANKGMHFEAIIIASIQQFNKNIKHFLLKEMLILKLKKVNKQEVLGSLAKRSQVDYYGFYNEIYFNFEAKNK